MNLINFENLVSEYQSEGIGDLLYNFIRDIVKISIYSYPPMIYSPNKIWDEDSIDELCQDFLVNKLIANRILDHYLLSLETIEQLKSVLKRDFRQFLINQRRKDELQNIFQRTKKILTTSPKFKNIPSSKLWGLVNWDITNSTQDIVKIIDAMYKVDLPPTINYRATSRKLSHLISNEVLERLLTESLENIQEFVDINLLMEAIRYRLNLIEIQMVSLDDPLNSEDEHSESLSETISNNQYEVSSQIEVMEIAHDIFSSLSDRQKSTLTIYFSLSNPTLEKVAERLSISKSSVDNYLTQIQKHIHNANVNENEAEQILEILSNLCLEN